MTKIPTVLIWAFFTLCIISVITLPISLQTQLIASITVVTLMAILKILKAEGTWRGVDGDIWFVASYAGGPLAEDPADVTASAHAGQIWRYSPRREAIQLVALFPIGSDFDGPDNITASPHGFALACTDGENAQYLVGINDAGEAFPFGLNVLSGSEFAGATFSPDGGTLFVNIQGPPGLTLAIWGPWNRG